MWEEHVNRFQMRAGHGKNVRGAIDQRRSQRLAAESRDIHVFVFAHLHRIKTRRLTAHRVHACRSDLDVLAIADQTAKKPFGDGAAANISRANKEDAFHDERAAPAYAKST